MFTGIIETTGKVQSVTREGSSAIFWITSSLAPELKIDQSVSHNGACLTVEDIKSNTHRVTAIAETLSKTNLDSWTTGAAINLERCLQMNGRLDGHLVQGHVDSTGICTSIDSKNGSWEYRFNFPAQFSALIIEKGSICINGISLTAFNVDNDAFSVAIIPYTYEHTNIKEVKVNDSVNLEFDMVGKYIHRSLSLKNN